MAISIAKAQPAQQKEFPESNSIAVEEVNMLENGGLEKWYQLALPFDMPNGWFCHNNTNVRKEKKIVCEGTFSAKM